MLAYGAGVTPLALNLGFGGALARGRSAPMLDDQTYIEQLMRAFEDLNTGVAGPPADAKQGGIPDGDDPSHPIAPALGPELPLLTVPPRGPP
eukprot:1563721-Heterocapsa_arctica.AAC.1